MTAVYIILGIFAYLAIGGFLSGLFDDIGLDEFMWYTAWPFVLIYVVVMLTAMPFENLGLRVVRKLRELRNRKKK
jgi:hypothetical protein